MLAVGGASAGPSPSRRSVEQRQQRRRRSRARDERGRSGAPVRLGELRTLRARARVRGPRRPRDPPPTLEAAAGRHRSRTSRSWPRCDIVEQRLRRHRCRRSRASNAPASEHRTCLGLSRLALAGTREILAASARRRRPAREERTLRRGTPRRCDARTTRRGDVPLPRAAREHALHHRATRPRARAASPCSRASACRRTARPSRSASTRLASASSSRPRSISASAMEDQHDSSQTANGPAAPRALAREPATASSNLPPSVSDVVRAAQAARALEP